MKRTIVILILTAIAGFLLYFGFILYGLSQMPSNEEYAARDREIARYDDQQRKVFASQSEAIKASRAKRSIDSLITICRHSSPPSELASPLSRKARELITEFCGQLQTVEFYQSTPFDFGDAMYDFYDHKLSCTILDSCQISPSARLILFAVHSPGEKIYVFRSVCEGENKLYIYDWQLQSDSELALNMPGITQKDRALISYLTEKSRHPEALQSFAAYLDESHLFKGRKYKRYQLILKDEKFREVQRPVK